MQETIECINARKLARTLRNKGYKIGQQGHIYPDPTTLPEDYPWSYGNRGPVGKEADEHPDHPLPCAFLYGVNIFGFCLSGKSRLDLVNLHHPEINPYHNQIRELAKLGRI